MQLHACLAGTSTATASLKAAVHVSESDELNDPTTFINSQHLEDTAGVGLSPAGAIAKRCLVVGCKHKSSFKSAYGLTRHTQNVHGTISAKRFVCGARGCFNGHLPWSFARPDKLPKSRQRTSITNQCPVATCTYGPCILEVFGVHIQHAHHGLEEGRAVFNATPCKARRCPLWRCGKYIATDQLRAHVITHASEDIEAAKPSLELEGFLIEGTSLNGIAVHVVCPVCLTATTDAKQFAQHMANDHLYASNSGGYVHFEKWKAYWETSAAKYKSEVKTLLP
jgi:hypothetical protein